jgi:hypothetical protein
VIVYHVTEARNLRDIRNHGVLPEFATGKLKASWWISAGRVVWAIAHVCNRHRVTPDQVIILPAQIDICLLKATCYDGVFYMREKVDLKGRVAPMKGDEFLASDDRFPVPDNE